jgi:hypothetical protein
VARGPQAGVLPEGAEPGRLQTSETISQVCGAASVEAWRRWYHIHAQKKGLSP